MIFAPLRSAFNTKRLPRVLCWWQTAYECLDLERAARGLARTSLHWRWCASGLECNRRVRSRATGI